MFALPQALQPAAFTLAVALAALLAACGGGVGPAPSDDVAANAPSTQGSATPGTSSAQHATASTHAAAASTPAPPSEATSEPAGPLDETTAPPPAASSPAAAPGSAPVAAPVSRPVLPPVPPTPPEPPTAARIDRVLLGQVMIYPIDDPELVLVANKDALVVARLTTTDPAAAKPTGTVRVTDASGQLVADAALVPPTGPIPVRTPDDLGFDSIYSAVIPARHVHPGMKLDLRFAGGQLAQSVRPRVGAANPITLVMVPVRIGGESGETGQVLPYAADALRVRAPVSTVDVRVHPTFTSALKARPVDSATSFAGMTAVVREMSQLRLLEKADTRAHYAGFVPYRMFTGIGGLGQRPGAALAVVDTPGDPGWGATIVMHELGHNFGLGHAPCGGALTLDPNYPYANAALGAKGRWIWSYLADSQTFVDPRDPVQHDLMSYCRHDTFSDYNYRLIQGWLNPEDASSTPGATPSDEPRELLLIAGTVSGNQVDLAPLKQFAGLPSAPEGAGFLLRLTTAGGVVDHPFAANAIDHDDSALMFSFSVASPGPLQRLQILRGNQVIHDRLSTASKSAPAGPRQKMSTPEVQMDERDGQLRLRWDAGAYPFLTVVHAGARRTVLAQDLEQGSATLPLAGVPLGGSYEFLLSDGLNSVRSTQPR